MYPRFILLPDLSTYPSCFILLPVHYSVCYCERCGLFRSGFTHFLFFSYIHLSLFLYSRNVLNFFVALLSWERIQCIMRHHIPYADRTLLKEQWVRFRWWCVITLLEERYNLQAAKNVAWYNIDWQYNRLLPVHRQSNIGIICHFVWLALVNHCTLKLWWHFNNTSNMVVVGHTKCKL